MVRDVDIDVVLEEEIAIGAQKQLGASPNSKKDLADYGFMPGCPDCGAALIMAEGCMNCNSCGYSRCM